MKAGNYILKNEEKVDRALNGTLNNKGKFIGGVKKEDGTHVDSELLAEYDRIGGYITNKEGSKVKTGSFYDISNRKPFEKAEVTLIFQVNGEFVEIPENEEKPDIVKAVEKLEKVKGERKEAKEKAKEAKKKEKVSK